jgi:hypothetical protein
VFSLAQFIRWSNYYRAIDAIDIASHQMPMTINRRSEQLIVLWMLQAQLH